VAQGKQPKLGFIDNPHAPELFSTAATGFFVGEGCVHITFESVRVNHVTSPGPVNRVVIGRLIMPVAGAQALAIGLYDFLTKHGMDVAPSKEKMQ
jgi:hypothetical protein